MKMWTFFFWLIRCHFYTRYSNFNFTMFTSYEVHLIWYRVLTTQLFFLLCFLFSMNFELRGSFFQKKLHFVANRSKPQALIFGKNDNLFFQMGWLDTKKLNFCGVILCFYFPFYFDVHNSSNLSLKLKK